MPLSMDEYFSMVSLGDRLDAGSMEPDEILAVIKILERERANKIADNMRRVIEEEEREENYD